MLDLSQKSKIESFRHFSNEWQQIRDTLLSCERLLHVMSDEHNNRHEDNNTRQQQRPQLSTYHMRDETTDSTSDETVSREKIREIISKIEPKKYRSKRRSIHKLKQLTQKLMTTNLKRSTSLQTIAVAVKPNDVTDDTTATLPRLRRRPRFQRFYHSLDVSDDNTNDCDPNNTIKDNSNDSNILLSSPTNQLSVESQQQHELASNRHSCDVTSLLLSPTSQSSSLLREGASQSANRQILKYSKKRLRGPYGEMLESMMNTKNTTEDNADVKQNLSFIQELLKETEKQRKELDGNAKETTGTSTIDITATQTPSIDTTAQTSITATIGRHLDTRTHIVGELYDTEKSFCEQLRDLCEKYSKPLSESLIIDSIFIDLIFGKIPEILSIHSKFLEELRHRISEWKPLETTIGDLFEIFNEEKCFTTYLSFVDNWFESKTLIKTLLREKPLFGKFLEQKSRENKHKLSLDELMISVIQRIPRFELLLKNLLKNTEKEHKDYELLSEALKKIHSLVLNINRVKNDADVGQQTQLQDIQLLSLKDFEFLCDSFPTQSLTQQQKIQLISTVFIRKRERILLLFENYLIILGIKGKRKSEKFEENKYKVLNYFSIDFLELLTNDLLMNRNSEIILEKDLEILESIKTKQLQELSLISRSTIEPIFQDLCQTIHKQLIDYRNCDKNLELIVLKTERERETDSKERETILISFQTQEKRREFQELFQELKQRLRETQNKSKYIPEFLCALPIRKTRAGLQFTCAEPTIGCTGSNNSEPDVWICNSDGFVGQISVLSLNNSSEPTVISCNGVCNSRIICIKCVPFLSQQQLSEESDVSDSDCYESDTNVSGKRGPIQSSTMWFGTDDSSVHIYSCFDAIRIKKNKIKVTLSAKVEAIAYFSDRVFVSLANQTVAIFDRDPVLNSWKTFPTIIRENMNCFRFMCCGIQSLWTTNQLFITIRDKNLDPIHKELHLESTNDDFITCLEYLEEKNYCFISTNNSLMIYLFSTQNPFQILNKISIQTSLQKALISCEDIIRQHKSACLKISALLAVKDKLWIGTSAGIICVLDSNQLEIEIVSNGHTGHVRFLTSVETQNGKTLVISGGDGIECYNSSNSSGGQSCGQLLLQSLNTTTDTNGREDSTNHLLLWTI